MRICVTILLALVALCASDKGSKYPPLGLSYYTEQAARSETEEGLEGVGWGWKNPELKRADSSGEGWGKREQTAFKGETKGDRSPSQPPKDDSTETTSVPILLVPSEPDDSDEPPVVITGSTGPDSWQSNDDGRDTIHLLGGDAEKEKAVDWGNEGYKQLKTAEHWESWKMANNEAEGFEVASKGPKAKGTHHKGTKGKDKGAHTEVTKAKGPQKGSNFDTTEGKGSYKGAKGPQKGGHFEATESKGYKGEKGSQKGSHFEAKGSKASYKAEKGGHFEAKGSYKGPQKGSNFQVSKGEGGDKGAKGGWKGKASAATNYKSKSFKARESEEEHYELHGDVQPQLAPHW